MPAFAEATDMAGEGADDPLGVTKGAGKMRLSLVAGLLVAATIVPGAADAGPVRAAAAGTATAVTVTGRTAVRGTVVVGRTAAKGTAVVGRTAVRGTAAAGRGLARGTVCVATFFRRCAPRYP